MQTFQITWTWRNINFQTPWQIFWIYKRLSNIYLKRYNKIGYTKKNKTDGNLTTITVDKIKKPDILP